MRSSAFMQIALTACIAAAILLSGCTDRGTIARGTPEATARALLRAVKAQDYAKVMEDIPIDQFARRVHADWESLNETDRQAALIEMQATYEQQLRELHREYLAGKVHISEVEVREEEDGTATVFIKTERRGYFSAVLIQKDGLWEVSGLGPAGGLSQ